MKINFLLFLLLPSLFTQIELNLRFFQFFIKLHQIKLKQSECHLSKVSPSLSFVVIIIIDFLTEHCLSPSSLLFSSLQPETKSLSNKEIMKSMERSLPKKVKTRIVASILGSEAVQA